jgi:anti-sigma-K factor RskA
MKDMFDKKNSPGADERLDLIGREIVRASAANEDEAERVTASPFLYTRLRSRINAERGRREERESWLTMLGIVWRAIPAMAMVAVLAVALFLTASSGTRPSETLVYESLLGTSEAGVESVVFADNRALSSDEVLATILDEDMQEASR